MPSLLTASSALQQRAYAIIEETKIIEIWSAIGATINLVGSLKTGLIIKKQDIDFHIYTNPFNLSDSFSAISRLAQNPHIKTLTYTNLLDAEDRCIEWHAGYQDDSEDAWQIDMIHILNDSPYAGYFEKVAERINAVLTDETRRAAILSIKNDIPLEKHVMGIEVYKAVIDGGVRDTDSFWTWKARQPDEGIITWCP
jgi:hypothetical protein